MKVYDCMLYHDEDLILDLRLNILNNYVDKFVICESKYSHSGRQKKLNFNINNFKKFKDKIIYIVAENEPDGLLYKENSGRIESPENYRYNAIKRIAHQRNKLQEALEEAESEDFILYSDNDEIPNLENIDIEQFSEKYLLFEQKLFYFKLNLYTNRINWFGTKGCKKKIPKKF